MLRKLLIQIPLSLPETFDSRLFLHLISHALGFLFRFKFIFLVLIQGFQELGVFFRVLTIDYPIIVIGNLAVVNNSQVVKQGGKHLVVSVCIFERYLKLGFDVLVGHFLAYKPTETHDHVIKRLLSPCYLLEVGILK